MNSRRSGLLAGVVSVRSHRVRSAHFDRLEPRQLLAAHAHDYATELVDSPTVIHLAAAKSKALINAGANLFKGVSSVTAARNAATQHLNANSYSAFTVGLKSVKELLAAAPMEFTAASKNPLVLALPTPDGSFDRFKIVEAPIMEPALAAKYSSIKTYRGIGIDDPTASVRLDYTQLGFHAQVLAGEESYYIDPYHLNDVNGTYVSYFKHDLVAADADKWLCEVEDELEHAHEEHADEDAGISAGNLLDITYGGTLKTYRAAVGASYQYTQAVGGNTVAGGQAAIVTAMNRVTGVYETELAIRMVLVANNDQLVYTTATSGSSFSNGSSVINTSTSKISGIIGVGNYDIGHVFTTASGGVAGLGVVGSSSSKGRGTTGLPSPIGDAFYIDYVAHEMGHQFGGNHTFNTAFDTGNRNASTAYEGGSGVTIMAYAGLEGNDDIALNSIPYFHAASIDEIRNFITLSIPGVGTATATGNQAPVVDAGANYIIPTGTNFALTATGSDPDGDALTYDWQEMDLGPANNLNSADNGTSPLFRVFPPVSSPTRTFPRLPSILAGLTYFGNYAGSTTYRSERLPEVARAAMKFRVIARDNRVGGGGVATDDMQIQVVNTGGAFTITNFNSSSTIAGGSFQTINWNVAGTTANGINVANVNIKLSLDGGQTFPITLAGATANDGAETFQLPYGVGATNARLKVEPVGNIFFDINNANLNLTNVAVPTSQTPSTPALLSDTGTSNSDGLTNLNNSSPASVLNFQVGNTVAGALVELLIDGNVIGSATATGTTTLVSTNGSSLLNDGSHTFTARQTETGKPVSALATAGSFSIDTVAPVLASAPTFNFETGHSLTYLLGEDVAGFNTAAITVSDGTNTIPATVSYSGGTLTAAVTFGGLLPNGNYSATLGSTITDAAGNTLVAGAPLSFFVLAGDANRDRFVDFADLLIIAQNYETSGKTFSTGNFNYDATGTVDFDDLLIIAQAYETSLPALRTATPGTTRNATVAKKRSITDLV